MSESTNNTEIKSLMVFIITILLPSVYYNHNCIIVSLSQYAILNFYTNSGLMFGLLWIKIFLILI